MSDTRKPLSKSQAAKQIQREAQRSIRLLRKAASAIEDCLAEPLDSGDASIYASVALKLIEDAIPEMETWRDSWRNS